MRWIRFETHGHAAYGIVDGDTVTEVRGDPFAGYEKTATRHKLSSVKLLVPVEPRTFYCAGLNYAEHVIEAARKRGQEPNLPQAADIGYRANNALVAHGETYRHPEGRDRAGAVRGRAGRGDRQEGQASLAKKTRSPACSAGPSATT